MPTLLEYPIFVCHDWEYGGDYDRVCEFLDSARLFSWRNLSVPEHDPLDTDDMLEKNLRDQIRPASVVLVLAGMYTARSQWMDWEMSFARRIGRPIVAVIPFGARVVPKAVQRHARDFVGWRQDSIVRAIRHHGRLA